MSQQFQDLVKSFDKAIQSKADGKFGKQDVEEIYSTASKAFDGTTYLDQNQVNQIRDRLVKLAEGHIDKGRATKKLQGTSRAEAIRSVLQSML